MKKIRIFAISQIKQHVLYFLLAGVMVISACSSKSGNPEPGKPPVDGGGDNNPPASTPYVVKTLGASNAAAWTTNKDGKLSPFEITVSDGAGNVIQLEHTGSEIYSISIENIDEPKINEDGSYLRLTFPKQYMRKSVADVTPSDSLKAPTIKVKGFKNQSFNQLNFVLVDDGVSLAQSISFKSLKQTSQLNMDGIRSTFSGKIGIARLTIGGHRVDL